MRYGPESFTFLYDRWVGFLTASLIMSIVQGVAVYVASFREGALLALGGNSGNPIYDVRFVFPPFLHLLRLTFVFLQFYIGRELNPSIGSFDIKSFNELRPGLILWVLIDISMACAQAARRGGWGNVTWSMWLVLAFQGFYVADGLYNEVSMTSSFSLHCGANKPAAGHSHDHGHYDRWIWIHALCRRSHLGSLCVLAPGTLPCLQTCRTRRCNHRRHLGCQRPGLLDLQRCERGEE